jgi:signal transduction histidine kinase
MSLALPGWLRHPSHRTKDVTLAALVGLAVVSGAIAEAVHHDQPVYVAVGALAVIPFWWRRRHPVPVLAAVLLIGLALPDLVIVQLAGAVVLYQVAATRSPGVIAASVAALLSATAFHEALWTTGFGAGNVAGSAVLCGVSVAFGLGIANRRTNIAALNERAERLELQAEQAVSDERVRIARELHDVVAHNVSLMVVQAQALGATVKEPGVEEATTGIADLGRQAMTEMHRTLELLRGRDGSADRAPRPGLDSLDKLVEQSRTAGLEVDFAVDGAPRALSQSLDLSAFRILQEALTNARKHASDARTSVTVAYGPRALDLTIRSTAGRAPSANGSGGGHGITGMRERAALFGGSLEAGPREDGAFEVHAVLPYDEDRSR